MRLAPALFLASLLACSTPRAKPSYTDVDSLPSALATQRASAAMPAFTAPVDVTPTVGRARAPMLSDAQVIATLQAAWSEEVLPATKGRTRPDAGQYSAAVSDTKRLSARRVECRAGHRRVDNTLGGAERSDLVFFSSISALDRSGECWEVTVPTNAFNEILAYFEPETGALLMVWLVPEG